jgi:hypothetical protein
MNDRGNTERDVGEEGLVGCLIMPITDDERGRFRELADRIVARAGADPVLVSMADAIDRLLFEQASLRRKVARLRSKLGCETCGRTLIRICEECDRDH